MRDTSVDLLVFDWDGTLIDSIGSIVDCTLATFEALGLGPLPEAEVRRTVGLGLKETVETLLPDTPIELRNQVREVYFKHWIGGFCDQPRLFPCAEATLGKLQEEGFLLAIATGKSRRGLERDLARVGLRECFLTTRTVDEAPSKPDPTMLLDILDDLGVWPARAIMVGDTTYDLQMAAAAGAGAVGVHSGSHTADQLCTLTPLACLPSVGDFPAWLRSHQGHSEVVGNATSALPGPSRRQ